MRRVHFARPELAGLLALALSLGCRGEPPHGRGDGGAGPGSGSTSAGEPTTATGAAPQRDGVRVLT